MCSSASCFSILAMSGIDAPTFFASRAGHKEYLRRCARMTARSCRHSARCRRPDLFYRALVSARMLRLLLRKVNALVRAENAADDDAAFDLVIARPCSASSSISPSPSKIGSPFLTDRVRPGKVDRNGELGAQNLARRKNERMAGLQSHVIAGDGADADFRSGKILQNRHGTSQLALELADFADHAAMRRIIAVTEVQPSDIHAGANQAFEHLVGRSGGSDGADNFRATHFD